MKSLFNKKRFVQFLLGTILLMTAAVALSCSLDSYAPEEHFFIKTNGAILPVWVMRNENSNVFIIHNHGGMGTSYYKTYYEAYQNLRQD